MFTKFEKNKFILHSDFGLAGDQGQAVDALVHGIQDGKRDQVLLGITGSGKTFTMANIIQRLQRPSLILAHNKILAAQLYQEMKSFFPENAVEYFVSYYDYYQPEAYIPKTDTYIEKDSAINEEIDRMRHSATQSLLERRDTIIVASVSCIYGIGNREDYARSKLSLCVGQKIELTDVIKVLVSLQYQRNQVAFERGLFRVAGDTLDVFPAHQDNTAWRVVFFGDEIESIYAIDTTSGIKKEKLNEIVIYPATHFVVPKASVEQAIVEIKKEMEERVNWFTQNNRLIEAQRIRERTQYDIEMILSTGSCKGIENYSRFFTGRKAGQAPPTLFEYLPEDALLFVDESHVSVPQIGAMYGGDKSRKDNLAEFGFRLPSCRDNRPLKFDEWNQMRPQTIFVSATPGPFELEQTKGEFVEQIIRPTGLLDPICIVRPTENSVDNALAECRQVIEQGGRVLMTTLTKKMAQDLTDYFLMKGVKARYMHSDVDTLERIEIIKDLRQGVIDVLIGINLLREGLDIPECQMVVIFDADKTGFLRSKTSLIQTIGRAARHVDGRVILYADTMTSALEEAINETNRRRQKQILFNQEHHIIPRSVQKRSDSLTLQKSEKVIPLNDDEIRILEQKMKMYADQMEFEKAIEIRNQIHQLSKNKILSEA